MRTVASLASMILCLQAAAGASAGETEALSYAGIRIMSAGGAKKAVAVVQPDGSVVGKIGAGKADPDDREVPQAATIAKIVGNGILDTAGTLDFRLEADGSVTGRDVRKQLKFNAADELLGEDGVRMLWLAPDGTPQMGMHGKTAPLPLKVEGFDARTRRMAVLLVLAMWMPKPAGADAAAPAAPKAEAAANPGP